MTMLPATQCPEVEWTEGAILCDSMKPVPFLLTFEETEDLLTACALEAVERLNNDAFGHDITWGCFLITDAGSAIESL